MSNLPIPVMISVFVTPIFSIIFLFWRLKMDDFSERDPAPSSLRYLVFFSGIFCFTGAAAFFVQTFGQGTNEQEFLTTMAALLLDVGVLSFFEFFYLKKNRQIFGAYGAALVIEGLKLALFTIGSQEYPKIVKEGSSSTFLLLQITSVVAIIVVLATKIARSKIESLGEKNVSRNVLNLLPSLLVIAIFLGTYATEIAGLGTPRQKKDVEEWINAPFDLSMFNTPTWDATYLLENILDQFTAGLSMPDVPLFNVTSDQSDPREPTVYWRLGTLDTYKYYDRPPYTTDWDASDKLKRILSPVPLAVNNTYSRQVPEGARQENGARFIIKMNLNWSTQDGVVTINPSFPNHLPVTWNGEYGSYVSSNSFKFYDADGNEITPASVSAKETFPNAYSEDTTGIVLDAQFASTSEKEGLFEYTFDYVQPDLQQYAAFSLTREDSVYESILGKDTWEAVKSLYLQLPNQTGTLPTTCFVNRSAVGLGYNREEPNPNNLYEVWAPDVVKASEDWDDPQNSVFMQAYELMNKFSPTEGNFSFDQQMWLGEQVGTTMDHPEEKEDFNQWFFNRKKGVSLHFASTYATILRLQKIPSRVVIGYIAGNNSAEYYPERVVTARFLHAWTEVLVPIDPNPLIDGDEYVAWVSFDPLILYLAALYGLSLPGDISSPAKAYRFLSPTFDISKTLGEAIAENAFTGNIIDYLLVDEAVPDQKIVHNEVFNLSVRLVRISSASSPPLPVDGVRIILYAGTRENGSYTEFNLSSMYNLGEIRTNSEGLIFVSLVADFNILGWRENVVIYARAVDDETGETLCPDALSSDLTFALF